MTHTPSSPATLICQNCHKNPATVTVVEIQPTSEKQPDPVFREEQLCEICAQAKNLPHAPAPHKALGNIWQLLQTSGQAVSEAENITCPDCGMTREEFRQTGRVGCPADYDLFADDVATLLERVHGAAEHAGRLPGVSPEALSRLESALELKKRLRVAIDDEAYENAARIRDELREMEQ